VSEISIVTVVPKLILLHFEGFISYLRIMILSSIPVHTQTCIFSAFTSRPTSLAAYNNYSWNFSPSKLT